MNTYIFENTLKLNGVCEIADKKLILIKNRWDGDNRGELFYKDEILQEYDMIPEPNGTYCYYNIQQTGKNKDFFQQAWWHQTVNAEIGLIICEGNKAKK